MNEKLKDLLRRFLALTSKQQDTILEDLETAFETRIRVFEVWNTNKLLHKN